MEDLLQAILENAQRQQASSRQPAAQADPLADLIQGILGGQSRRAAPVPQPTQADPIADLIGGLIGGQTGSSRGNGQILDLIGAIMGANQQRSSGIRGGTAGINPIAAILAQRLGIPPQMAQMIVGFFMANMMKRLMTQRQQPDNFRGIGRDQQDDDDLDLDDLLEVMDDERTLGSRLQRTGMDRDLARQTGMNQADAQRTLQELVKIIGGQRQQNIRPVQPQRNDLQDLLDAW